VLSFLLAGAASVFAQDLTTDPAGVQLEVADIRRLAQVLHTADADTTSDLASAIDREYLRHASPGLRSYATNFNVSGASIAEARVARPDAYANLDGLADAILAKEPELRAAFRRLQAMFPEAVFPPIWFVVGHHGAGGLLRPEGVLIAAERLVGQPDDVVPLVLHEVAHFQQVMVQGVEVYRSIYGPEQTLLALALREGSAELLAELTAGRHINPDADAYGSAHELELWSRFRETMHGSDTGEWMFVRPANSEWPPDLGYWIGYRIAKSYYEQAENKEEAIRSILGLTDFTAFLEESRYIGRE
jgi:hypothetical protein